LTLGVELELQLLNTHHYDMTPYAPDMLALLKNAKVPGSIVPGDLQHDRDLDRHLSGCTGRL
jgi:gamma-glutamyl:cysteine ligase YbdK (ATP-grasp superfamily)